MGIRLMAVTAGRVGEGQSAVQQLERQRRIGPMTAAAVGMDEESQSYGNVERQIMNKTVSWCCWGLGMGLQSTLS